MNKYSAIVSSFLDRALSFARIDTKEKLQLNARITIRTAVISSIVVLLGTPKPLMDVRTRKLKPRRLEDVERICDDVLSMCRFVIVMINTYDYKF